MFGIRFQVASKLLVWDVLGRTGRVGKVLELEVSACQAPSTHCHGRGGHIVRERPVDRVWWREPVPQVAVCVLLDCRLRLRAKLSRNRREECASGRRRGWYRQRLGDFWAPVPDSTGGGLTLKDCNIEPCVAEVTSCRSARCARANYRDAADRVVECVVRHGR